MREDENYWLRRLRAGAVSRRRFVGGAAATGLGAAALGLVGCGDDDDDGTAPTGTASTGTATASATGSATQAANQPQQGGIARLVSANNTWDTFDIDRSRFSPVAWLHGLTHQGILQWRSFNQGIIEGAMAADLPEQVDDTTAIIKLRPNVFWHDKAPVNGRAATAQDIASFIERNRVGKLQDGTDDPNFYRKAAYAKVETVEVTDESTVTVTFNAPDPFFVTTIASAYAKVMAPELIAEKEDSLQNLSAENVIGTGGFVLEKFAAEGETSWRRHEKFHGQVNWDGIEWKPLFTDQSSQQAAFEQKRIDAFGPTNNAVIDDLNAQYEGEITETRYFAANPQAGTYYGGAAPWNNANLVGAIFKAMDRRALIQSLLQGKAALAGNVPPMQPAFSIPERELITFEGYREDRGAEEAEARQMWEAGGGPALGEITVDIPDIWEGLYSGGSALITSQLSKVLGNNFTAKIEPYATITGKIVNQQYGNGNNNIWYGWVTDVQDPEPTLLNYLSYNSASPQWAQFGVKIDKVDQLTLQGISEFDITRRQEISKEVMKELLKNWGAGIPYNLLGVTTLLSWNYFKFPEASPFVQQHLYASHYYFDQNDPTYQGRPS